MHRFFSRLIGSYGIGLKLAIVLAAFGILASGLTGYYSYNATREILVKGAGHDLLLSTQVLGRRFSVAVGEVAQDARFLARVPTARSIFTAPAGLQGRFKNELASQFSAMMTVHPEYFQVRLMSAAHNGVELVRVDRDAADLKRVEGLDLQEKAHYPYIFETLRLAQGQVHYSKIFINHEFGAHAGQEKPTLQVATPLVGADGKALGVMVINVDLERLFKFLKADLASDFNLYLVNQQGDYLIHPDPAKAFGFEQGRRFLVQDEFKPVAPVVEEQADYAMIWPKDEAQRSQSIGSFVRIPFGEAPGRQFVIMGLSVPLEKVLAGTDTVGRNTVQIVVAFSLLAILLSILVAGAFVRPLRQLVSAVRWFSQTHELQPLPTSRNDELGLLARSFSNMQEHILAHLDELNKRKDAMEHRATHDALTGAPNRAMFEDLMQFALASARRNSTQLAILFIDLDHFKQVNDSYGHAAGDAALIEVVVRINQTVRENDIVARLSGDEFVVLLQQVENDDQVKTVAQKLIDALNEPIEHEAHVLGIGASIGISLFPRDGDVTETLLHNADVAMYHAKRDGRNTYNFYGQMLAG
jgi:diguanylate cyclase (GGDEF)-like protein